MPDETRQPEPTRACGDVDPLDELLAAARWPEPTPAARERLEAAWAGHRRRPSAGRLGWRPSLAAAAVLLVVAGTWWAVNRPGDDAPHPAAVALHASGSVHATTPAVLESRPPTTLEMTLIAAMDRRAAKARATASEPTVVAEAPVTAETTVPPQGPPQVPPQPTDPYAEMLAAGTPAAVDQFLSCVEDPATSETALAAIAACPAPPTDALVARLDAARVDVRQAATRALGRINDPAVARRLAEMAMTDVNRREALAALASSDLPDAAEFLAFARESDALAAAARSALAQYGHP